VVDSYVEGSTINKALDSLGVDVEPGQLAIQGRVEAAVLRLLDGGHTRSRTVA
jgi:hypothetical protein